MSVMASKPLEAWELARQCLGNTKENIKAPRHWPFGKGIHRWSMNSPHQGQITRKTISCHDVIRLRAPWGDGSGACRFICRVFYNKQNNDVIMSTLSSQITSLKIAYSTVHSGADQRKHQRSASLTFVRGIHRWPVNSRHKEPVTQKVFPFDDVIMVYLISTSILSLKIVKIPGVWVPKAPFVNFSVSRIFDLVRVHVRLFQPHSYLTGVTAAQLRRHLPKINVIFNT